MIRSVRVELERDPDDGWWRQATAVVLLDDRELRFGEIQDPALVHWIDVTPSHDGAVSRLVTPEDSDRLSDHEDWAIELAREQLR